MRISRYFRLGRTQYELDFVDIDTNRDTPLFLDPYFLGTRNDQWSIQASRTIRSFFEYFITLVRSGARDEARELFEHLNEPNETCLGLSKGRPRGRGVGEINSDDLFASLLESRAVATGVVEHLEDCRIFIEGIGKDKISDMATNIIRGNLIEYTQSQCALWGIPLQPDVPSGYMWAPRDRAWQTVHADMLVVRDKPILLVPKAVVSYTDAHTDQKYHQHFVLSYLKNEHLRLNTALVQRYIRRDGSERRFVSKKSVKESEAPLTKEFLLRFTEAHPEIFRKFKEEAARGVDSVEGAPTVFEDLPQIIDHLIAELRALPAGPDNATRYHRTVVGILELLFYPRLFAPQIEHEIHEGRKRIDITFDNGAREGFFQRLQTTYRTSCQYIMVECKNYSRDIANPELDQMGARFSPNRGQFGLVVCRRVEDMNTLLARCADTYRDHRGIILPLVDDDLIALLERLKEGASKPDEDLLQDRLRAVALT